MAAPTPSPCAERRRLTVALQEAVNGIAKLSKPQSREAYVAETLKGQESDTQSAERKRSAATHALLKHIKEHGCQL